MAVRVHTTDFEFAHGRKPRGEGTWAFFFHRRATTEHAFWANGSYSEAKRQAVEYAKAHGFEDVYVGS